MSTRMCLGLAVAISIFLAVGTVGCTSRTPESSVVGEAQLAQGSSGNRSEDNEGEGRSEDDGPVDISEGSGSVDSSAGAADGVETPPEVEQPPTSDAPKLYNEELWATRMSLPTADETLSYSAYERSPYLVCRPDFEGARGYCEYAVDFRADALPRGTYLCVCNWDMDLSGLRSRYADVHREYEGVAAYAGFQVLEDGSHVAIMSVWDTYVADAGGKTTSLRATRTYPDNPRVGEEFGGEGSGTHTLVDYDWQAGRTYRALIQCSRTDGGTTELLFYVCDLASGRWDELVAYDLGYDSAYMTSACCFLEDFLIETAAEVRTMELSNFRVNPVGGDSWVAARSATMEQDFEYPGSYNFGSEADCFWAISTAIPSRCSLPPNYERYSVSEAASGSPY